jgi:hypothetical protein
MELILRDTGMQSLREHLSRSKDYCQSLASQFQQAPTSLEQTNLAFRWDAALKHSYMVEFLLDLLKRREGEGRQPVGVQHIRLKAHSRRSSATEPRFTHESAATGTFTPRISSTSSSA